jgi:hypothetical protein
VEINYIDVVPLAYIFGLYQPWKHRERQLELVLPTRSVEPERRQG